MKFARRRRWTGFAALVISVAVAFAMPARAQESFVSAAQLQFKAGNYTGAVNTLQSGMGQKSQNAEAYFWLCRAYYELREFDNAIPNCEQAVQYASQNSDYHMWLGRAYGEKAERESSFLLARKVKKEFEEAVRLNPRNIPARRNLAEFYAQAPWIVGGSKDGAKQQVDAVAALDPVQGHLARAQFWLDQKRPDLADGEYRQALAAKPADPSAYYEAADFYAAQGRAQEMKSAVDSAAGRSNDSRLMFYRGVESFFAQATAQAEQSLKSYLASTPDRSEWPSHAAAREWLGRLYEAEGKRTEAAEEYRAALQLEPKRTSASDRLKKLEQGAK
jgi:tetratricopeptide (TPR) repeat protein